MFLNARAVMTEGVRAPYGNGKPPSSVALGPLFTLDSAVCRDLRPHADLGAYRVARSLSLTKLSAPSAMHTGPHGL